MYHYFDSKEHLYEAVFFAVAPAVWQQMAESVRDTPTMLAGIEALMRDRGGPRDHTSARSSRGCPRSPHSTPSSSTSSRPAPRSRTRCSGPWRTRAANGELAGLTVDQATELLRAIVMGWFFERHFAGTERDATVDAVLTAFRLMVTGFQRLDAQQAPAPRGSARE